MKNERNEKAIKFLLEHNDFAFDLFRWNSNRIIKKHNDIISGTNIDIAQIRNKIVNGWYEDNGISNNPEYHDCNDSDCENEHGRKERSELDWQDEQMHEEDCLVDDLKENDFIKYYEYTENRQPWKNDLEKIIKEFEIVIPEINATEFVFEKIFRSILTDDLVDSILSTFASLIDEKYYKHGEVIEFLVNNKNFTSDLLHWYDEQNGKEEDYFVKSNTCEHNRAHMRAKDQFDVNWIFGCIECDDPDWRGCLERLAISNDIIFDFKQKDLVTANTIMEKIFKPVLQDKYILSFIQTM